MKPGLLLSTAATFTLNQRSGWRAAVSQAILLVCLDNDDTANDDEDEEKKEKKLMKLMAMVNYQQ